MTVFDSLFMWSLWILAFISNFPVQSKINKARKQNDQYAYLDAIYHVLFTICCLLSILAYKALRDM